MKLELLKVIVDDPGKSGDRRDAKIHLETIIKDYEKHVRAKIAELNIVSQYTVATVPLSILIRLVGIEGYRLRTVEYHKED